LTEAAKQVLERHRRAIERKNHRIDMYRAILETWEGRKDCDHDYLREVRRRLHQAESQLKVMRP
jgi:hypothetical protein